MDVPVRLEDEDMLCSIDAFTHHQVVQIQETVCYQTTLNFT